MIKFSLAIPNQWTKDETNYKPLFKYGKYITKNKIFRIEYYRATVINLISLYIDLRWRGDSHIGPEIHMELNGYMVRISIGDRRPWNYTLGRWEEIPK